MYAGQYFGHYHGHWYGYTTTQPATVERKRGAGVGTHRQETLPLYGRLSGELAGHYRLNGRLNAMSSATARLEARAGIEARAKARALASASLAGLGYVKGNADSIDLEALLALLDDEDSLL